MTATHEAFEPIAIVGRGCVLPGALDPDALWRLVREQGSAIEAATDADWGIPDWVDREVLQAAVQTRAAGLVRGFAEVDPELDGLDEFVHWIVAAGRQALAELGDQAAGPRGRGGLVLGNLSYPTASLNTLALEVWSGADASIDPRNRFMSGLPGQLAARRLGLDAGGYCLDAACASSLYAIELACRRLQRREVDLMLAGGVNHADDLFLHLGFRALRASSASGRSRPFHAEADGLVPAHGAAVVALRRLDDARTRGERVLAVIRGIGLGNDGRAGNMMAPQEDGQTRAMRAAYAMSGIDPARVSYVECHATGTPVGDRIELRSMKQVFTERPVAVGSLKANLGHLITASGAASLLKVIAAMHAGELPPTPGLADAPLNPELADGPFRVVHRVEPWTDDGPERPRVAAISNFGFGGNNAHLVLESWSGQSIATAAHGDRRARPSRVAVVAQAVRRNQDQTETTPSGQTQAPIELQLGEVRTPPIDLQQTLPQQLAVLRLALDLASTIAALPSERTGLFAGMQCDAEIARTALRFRHRLTDDALAEIPGAGEVQAALVLGCMPNVVANRVSAHFDLRGPCFSVSAEQASGTVALQLAVDKLADGEIDAAVVAAVDLSVEPIHAAAAAATLPAHLREPADGAVVLVLEREADAARRGTRVLAWIDVAPSEVGTAGPTLRLDDDEAGLTPDLGHSHAASGLLHVAALVHASRRRALPPDGHARRLPVPWLPGDGRRQAAFELRGLGGLATRTVVSAPQRPLAPDDAPVGEGPHLVWFAAEDLDGLRRRVAAGELGGRGPVRLAVVAKTRAELEARLQAARDMRDPSARPDGVYFTTAPLLAPAASGRQRGLGFVFTGPASAYPNMGRELGLAFPELIDAVGHEFASLHDYVGWIYSGRERPPTPAEKLWASSFLIQLHAKLTQGVLGMRPDAAIGYCAGESNALFAMGAWQDFESLARDIHACELYTRELGGEMHSARRAWQLSEDAAAVEWATLRLLAPVAAVRDALAGEARAHLTMVNSPIDVVIAGEAAACDRVIDKVGRHRARSIGYDFIMHCPEAREFEAGWRALHHRPTQAIDGLRFYSHAHLAAYPIDRDTVADALTGQAMGKIDFPALIEQAYADGVRVFVEHGPLSGCSKWISATLGDRPHVSVPLDRYRESSLDQIADSLARLFVAGAEMDLAAFTSRVGDRPPAPTPRPAAGKRSLRFPLHWSRVRLTPEPNAKDAMQRMLPAPELPPVDRGVVFDRFTAGRPPPKSPRPPAPAPAPAVAAPQPVATPTAAAVPKPKLDAKPKPKPRPNAKALPAPRRSLPQTQGPGPSPVGPSFDRAQLVVHANGAISTLFGDRFAEQDRHARQVRMPCPPLLLADRVTGITGDQLAPGSAAMGRGTCWTETDVTDDAWYLHDGRMPAGIFVESGQADLFLISWLGADLLNRGERVYRLLGCELTSYGPLPKPGDTLVYDIHVDGHAAHGDVRLFFFHYDCRIDGEVRISVRNGQAGFFTYDELDNSAGVLWDPSEGPPTAEPRLDAPSCVSAKTVFDPDAVGAFADRRPFDCFGPGFERAQTHTRSPAIAGDRMRLVERVTHFQPPAGVHGSTGGPWGRGYLRATLPLERDSWFYAGHFHEDSCMPGTLMFQGGLQAMALYMAAVGCTLERDGWRFEPVSHETWKLSCRGQAVPGAREMVYEIFVDEFVAGPEPTLFATLLGSVDGRKAFLCPRIGLRLVPSWPLEGTAPARDAVPVASTPDGFRFGHDSMLACAWGKPSRAFGSLYAPFDGGRKVPRLPGPPYHFMTHIEAVEGAVGAMQVGSKVRAAYEVPADAWYFAANRNGAMPFAVLLEVALQPCGWLASYCGFAANHDGELFFRNLDGKQAIVHAEVSPDVGSLTTEATLTSASTLGAMIIVAFDVAVRSSAGPVYTLSTVFGFFPAEALVNQAGLPTDDDARARMLAPSPTPEREIDDDLGGRLAADRLATLDRVTGLWLDGGAAGLGRIRCARAIDASHWYFQAHFFQDPVQPGSIGIDAMLQALRLLATELGMAPDGTRFEVATVGQTMTWKYRGQVVPENREVVVDIEVVERSDDALVGRGSLWVDGKRIYEADGLGVRCVSAR